MSMLHSYGAVRKCQKLLRSRTVISKFVADIKSFIHIRISIGLICISADKSVSTRRPFCVANVPSRSHQCTIDRIGTSVDTHIYAKLGSNCLLDVAENASKLQCAKIKDP